MEASNETWLSWSTASYQPRQQFDAWDHAFNQAHAEWIFAKPDRSCFEGKLEQRHFGDIRLVNCLCDPMGARRTTYQIAQSRDAYYGVILVLQGDELLRCGANDFQIGGGDIFLWDTTRPAEFEILSRYRKISLLVPQDHMKKLLPDVDYFLTKKIETEHGLGAVVAGHLAALGQNVLNIGPAEGRMVIDLTLELVVTCLRSLRAEPSISHRKTLLQQIQNYIYQNLDDPELSPAHIAREHHISVRYLHQLFQEAGISVSHWILQRRLEQCRRDLLRTNAGNSVTEVAFRWGFNSTAHFSRAFRQQYGQSPSQYRKIIGEK